MLNSNKKKNKSRTKYNDELEVKSLKNRVLLELPQIAEEWTNPNFRSRNSLYSEDFKLESKRLNNEDIMSLDLFSDLPISRRTLEGLKSTGYCQMTSIQRCAIPHSLQGRDIIGQARTGSGKTLAYLVPVIENIYRRNCCSLDGLLALILTPTRELASQVFDVIRDIGKCHSTISAGCIVGGKDLKSESTRIHLLNILVATPGRLIQHMDESPLWNADNLIILVIDEVDRMLDMGFLKDIEIILDGIPDPSRGRQTMVFSATVELSGITSLSTNNKLFRMNNLKSISLENTSITPKLINQFYIEVPIHEKIDTLFNFLRTHSDKKVIVFVSCCKQVRFLATIFNKIKIGCKILELYGKQSLQKRLEVVHEFYIHEDRMNSNQKNKISKSKNLIKNKDFLNKKKSGVILFCTDIASRGLDFPKIDWVVQLDIPDTADTYIHRIGRTARYTSKGKSLLFLMPNEEYFIKDILNKGINSLKKVVPNKHEMRFTINSTLQSLCASDPNIREMAEKAFSAYVKSMFVLTSKERHQDLKELKFPEFALSMGLAIHPKIKLNFDYENNENRDLKRLSKLQKFKEKLKQKKDMDKQKHSFQKNDSNVNQHVICDIEDCISPISKSTEESNISKSELISRNLTLQKLKFKSDCSVKIRGHRELEFDKKHIFFNEEEQETELDLESRSKYIQQIKDRLKNQNESDKKRDRDRVHEMHYKRRVLSKQRKLNSEADIDELVIESDFEQIDDNCSVKENELEHLTTAALEKLGVNIK